MRCWPVRYLTAHVRRGTPLQDGIIGPPRKYVPPPRMSADPGLLLLSKFRGAANELTPRCWSTARLAAWRATIATCPVSMPLTERRSGGKR